MDNVLERAKVAVSIPFEFGHGDVGDVLVLLLKGEYTEEEALHDIECLIEDYTASHK